MQWRNGGFVPDNGQEGAFHNPQGSVPYPYPQNMPVGVWDGGSTRLRLEPDPDGYRVAEWGSPTFDLRPELRGTCKNADHFNNTQNFVEAVPIWGARGGVLWLQVLGLNNFPDSVDGLKVSVQEEASPNYVGQIQRFTDYYDVSDNFQSSDRKPCTILEFNPLGQGSPIRFWKIKIKFLWQEVLLNEPVFGLRSSFY